MKLERFHLRADFEKAFPEENSPDFLERLAWNLKNLSEETMEKNDYCAALLYYQLKTKGYKLEKFFVFVLFIILCLKRPWQKNWKWSIHEKDQQKVSDILKKFLEEFNDLPNAQTLRYHVKKEKFKEVVAQATLAPILSKLEEPFIDIFGDLLKELWKRKLDLESPFKFINEMSSQGCYQKRDLYKEKLRINKEHCDLLLKWAEDRDLIKLEKFSQGSIFITWNEPPERHRKSIDNL